MAPTKKKKKQLAIRFELRFGGLITLIVVCFCIFLWMFLLGIWAGQTVLQGSGGVSLKSLTGRSSPVPVGRGGGPGREEHVFSTPSKWVPVGGEETINEDAEPEYGDQAFFALQIGAYDSEARAIQAVAAWRARDQESFYTRPSGKESRFRVFVGKFDGLERANQQAVAVERLYDGQVYITLLRESEIVEP